MRITAYQSHLISLAMCGLFALVVAGCHSGKTSPITGVGPDQSSSQEAKRVPERTDIEKKHLWATENIFATAAEWEKELAALEKEIDGLAAFKGKMTSSPDQLLAALQLQDKLEPRIDRVYVYAQLLSDQDTRQGEMQAMRARAMALSIAYGQKTSWVSPELATLPQETANAWMDANEELAVYRQSFDNFYRQRKYILSAREEELLSLTSNVRSTPIQAYGLLTNADIKFPTMKDEHGRTVELDDSAFYLHMRSLDRDTRKRAYDAIVGEYAKYRNTAAALLNGSVQTHLLTVRARGYENCLQAALEGGAIPTQVYDNLINTVNKNLPLLHRYQKIRRKALGLKDGVRAYDLFAPLSTQMTPPSYEYEQAVDLIKTALKPLGREYLTPMAKGFDSRWVDVYPTKGKRSGAYSSGTFLTQPFILLNFHGGYEDMSTLAHEMGHSMHSYFSRGTQPYVYADYSIFCAEVASTCNEILLINHVLEQTEDPKVKLYLICEFLESFRGTIFRQTMFSEFEQRIHEMAEEGMPLTADNLGSAYGEIMKKYYGPDYVHDELVDNYWIRIPHFYYNFYVYKYATSFCAAANIANRIREGEAGAVDAYMQFLKAGSSKYPVDVLKLARVDMNSPEPIEDAMQLFERLLDQAEALLKEVK